MIDAMHVALERGLAKLTAEFRSSAGNSAWAISVDGSVNPRANQQVIWLYFPAKRPRPVNITDTGTLEVLRDLVCRA